MRLSWSCLPSCRTSIVKFASWPRRSDRHYRSEASLASYHIPRRNLTCQTAPSSSYSTNWHALHHSMWCWTNQSQSLHSIRRLSPLVKHLSSLVWADSGRNRFSGWSWKHESEKGFCWVSVRKSQWKWGKCLLPWLSLAEGYHTLSSWYCSSSVNVWWGWCRTGDTS